MDYREAIEKTVKITKTIYPRPEYKEIYEEKYATYRAKANIIWHCSI